MPWVFLHPHQAEKSQISWWIWLLSLPTTIKIHYQVVMLPIAEIRLSKLEEVLWLKGNSETFSMNSLRQLINARLIMMMSLLKALWEVIKVIKFQVSHLWNASDHFLCLKLLNLNNPSTQPLIKFINNF